MKQLSSSILLLFVMALSINADTTNTIAILDLKSTTVDAALLIPLANRLSSEIVKTGAYTVVERSEMETVLKEQGFQQSGCTDSSCAVQAGQLLNVRFIVTGTVDKLGSIYSINVRMINVATSAIARSISEDCEGCSIDDFVMKTVRRAALKLAGQEVADKSDEKVNEALAIKHFIYKGKREGKLGNITFDVKPIQSHVVFDDSGYGTGKVLIENVPAKRHRYKIVPDQQQYITGYGSVKVAPGEIAEVGMALRKAYVTLSASYGLGLFDGNFSLPADSFSLNVPAHTDSAGTSIPDVTVPITKKIQNSGAIPATLISAALSVETRWSYYSLVGHFSVGNLFGIPDRTNYDNLNSAGANHGNTAFSGDTIYYSTYVSNSFSSYFSYMRKVLNFGDALTICAGLNAGLGLTEMVVDFYKLQGPTGRALYNYNKDLLNNNNTSTPTGFGNYGSGGGSEFFLVNHGNGNSYMKIEQLDFGGPVFMLTTGAPKDRGRFFIHYQLGLGINNKQSDSVLRRNFALDNEFRAGWVFRWR